MINNILQDFFSIKKFKKKASSFGKEGEMQIMAASCFRTWKERKKGIPSLFQIKNQCA
jgi:hypothetical protein